MIVGVPAEALVCSMNTLRSSLAVSCNSIHRPESPTIACECSLLQTIGCSVVRDRHPDENYSSLVLTNKAGG